MKEQDKLILQKIRSLDHTRPGDHWDEEAIWETIQARMSSRSVRFFTPWVRYAAAVVMAFATLIFILIQKSGNPVVTHAHTMEVLPAEELVVQEFAEIEAEAELLIKSSCESDLPVCQTDEFRHYSAELQTLKEELKALDLMINKYGQDPSLVESRIQIENMKTEITLHLVQMIVS